MKVGALGTRILGAEVDYLLRSTPPHVSILIGRLSPVEPLRYQNRLRHEGATRATDQVVQIDSNIRVFGPAACTFKLCSPTGWAALALSATMRYGRGAI